MEEQTSTSGMYIKKTYRNKLKDKLPKPRIKKWIATISKDIDNLNPPISINWIKWVHNTVGFTHCFTCIRLNGCWFNNGNMPVQPLHKRCHCSTEPIPYSQVLSEAKSESDYGKFDPYLFNVGNKYTHNKEKLFEKWGYTIADAKWLQKEIEQQGREKYVLGEYTLGKLNHNGQRISIRVSIPRKNTDEFVSFITGWLVFPNGKIRLITPYGGK